MASSVETVSPVHPPDPPPPPSLQTHPLGYDPSFEEHLSPADLHMDPSEAIILNERGLLDLDNLRSTVLDHLRGRWEPEELGSGAEGDLTEVDRFLADLDHAVHQANFSLNQTDWYDLNGTESGGNTTHTKMYDIVHSDTILVVVSLIIMIILGLVCRQMCVKLTSVKNRKNKIRLGLKGIAEEMHNITRAMSDDLVLPDSPRTVMRVYSNANRKAQQTQEKTKEELVRALNEEHAEKMRTLHLEKEARMQALIQEHEARMKALSHDQDERCRITERDRLRIAVLASNQAKEEAMNQEHQQGLRVLQQVEVHQMKVLGKNKN